MVNHAIPESNGAPLTWLKTRVPVVLQAERNECGIACMAMLLGHYGRHRTLADLRTEAANGFLVSLERLITIARSEGMTARALRCEPGDFNQLIFPAIAHVDFDHYLVIEFIKKDSISIIDPARGRLSLRMHEFSRRFTGIVLELAPSADFEPVDRTINYSPLRFYRRLPLKNIAQGLALTFLLSLFIQGLALLSPLYVQIVVDEVILAKQQPLIHVVVLGFATIYLTSTFLKWLRGLLVIQLGSRLAFLLSAGLNQHLLSLSQSFFQRRTIGDVISRFASLQPLQWFLTQATAVMSLDLLLILTTLGLLATINVQVAVFTLISLTIYGLFQTWVLLPLRTANGEYILAEADLQTHFIESIQSIGTLKRYDTATQRISEWSHRLTRSINAQIRSNRFQLLVDNVRYLLTGLVLLGTVFLVADDISRGSFSVGMLYALVTYSNYLVSAFLSFADQWQQYSLLTLHVQRLDDLIETPVDDKVEVSPHEAGVQIQCLDVSFQYPLSTQPLLQNCNLVVEAGQKVAIVGPSGCGKSTLLKLLLGELQVSSGDIHIGAHRLQPDLRFTAYFSALFQEDQLLDTSVINNIIFSSDNIDHERAILCARQACIHDEILQLPLNYQEKVSENGHSLSSGQRQRLLIARALYRQAPILLLDEVTCHLDADLEQAVMGNVMKDPRTCLFITHNSSVAALADRTIHL